MTGIQGIDYEKILRSNDGLWYSYEEGKVRREWCREICEKAGLNADKLEADVWHIIPYKKETV